MQSGSLVMEMTRFLVAAAFGVGCTSTVVTPAMNGPSHDITVITPKHPPASFTVVPAELGDRDILERLGYRVRMHRNGKVWLRPDAPETEKMMSGEGSFEEVLPVADESRTKIR